jgi:N-acetylglucosamine-6-sulfatase
MTSRRGGRFVLWRTRSAQSWPRLLLLGLVLGGWVSGARTEAGHIRSAAEPRPSFIVIMTDDLSNAQLVALSRARTVVFASGTQFERLYVEAPICAPSRATFFTGRLAHNHGVVSVNTSGQLIRPHESSTFAVRLQDAGYRTAYYGKYINRYNGSYTPVGWTIWRAAQPCCVFKNQSFIIDGIRTTIPGLADRWMRDQAAELIRATPVGTPLLVVVAPMAPHLPHLAPPMHRGSFAGARVPRDASFNEADISDKPKFLRPPLLTPDQVQALDASWAASLEQLQTVDELVVGLYEALRDSGRLDSTYIVLTSDNGIHFGQHRQKEDKTRPWETDIRVPLLIRGPGVLPRVDTETLISYADIAPTLLDLAGLEAEDMDGISFAPALGGGSGRRTAAPIAFWAQASPYQLTWKGVRTGRHTFVEYPSGAKMLFDNVVDPPQDKNIAADPSQITLRNQLRTLSERLFICRGPVECAG